MSIIHDMKSYKPYTDVGLRINSSTTVGNNAICYAPILSILVLLAISVTPGLALAAGDWPPAPPIEAVPETNPGPLPPSITAETGRPGYWNCTFRYQPPKPVRSVVLAGTFNGWNRSDTPLGGPDAEGAWSVTIQLGPGMHQYKFVVDGQKWLTDPQNPDGQDDGHSGQNSVLRLGRLAGLDVSTAQRGDGKIEAVGLKHKSEQPRFFQPLARDRVLVRYRTLAHDVGRVWLATKGAGLTEMHIVHEDQRFALYETQVALSDQGPQGKVSRLDYTFVLSDGQERVSDPHTYSRSFTEAHIFRTPEWAKNAIWYQVMLDRFRNGNPDNDPQPVNTWTRDWFEGEPFELARGQTFYDYYAFKRHYGGDLDGLEEKLPYLKDLGVNAIYLNPVFKAESHHKYDATNYVHIDDHFGTKGDYEAVAASEDLLDPSTWKWTDSDKRFLRFLKKAHAMGFHVIIDGVFNHIGRPHPAFQDVVKNGRKSRFADWFDVTSWEPFECSGWAGFSDLPEFKKSPNGLSSESAKQHIFNVTRRWMDPDGDGDPSDGVDGWRLDVPNEIPAPFWVEWREVVKSVNPEGYITGEIWDRADQWLDGKHFDAVMNYSFSRAAVAWILDRGRKITVSEFDRRLQELRLAYPLPATLVMQNLMNSHDTDRLVSMSLNPDRAYDHANRVQDNGPNYDNSKPTPKDYTKARLVVLLQMTYVGAPMVYYGDEVGMWGADDPTCRKPMLWKELEPYDKPEENFVMSEHREFYQRAIKLRRAHPALRTGAFQTLLTDDQADVWAFLRWNDDEQLLVALNASDQPRTVSIPMVDLPKTWTAVFGLEGTFKAIDQRLSLQLPPLSGIVLHSPKAQ